jgi:DNA-binding HxlR family transcriptional regulator
MSPGCCPFQTAFDLLSKRHALTIIWLLQEKSPRRFTEIKRELEVNPVTLSQRLGDLERAGVLGRTEYSETPPRVEYHLTEKGSDLLPVIHQACQWADRWDARPVVAASWR